jgi:Lrp/AsnC family transcriptional regulator, leucine-responsive regulatory protein
MARRQVGPVLDEIAWRLLLALQSNGRASLKALAKECGLSVAATAETVERLQESGIVSGIYAEVDAVSLGFAVRAIIGITVAQPGKKALLEKLRLASEVLDCHHVAGADSYAFTAVARNLPDLERFIGTINIYGETRTSIVYSTPSARRGVIKLGVQKRSARMANTELT